MKHGRKIYDNEKVLVGNQGGKRLLVKPRCRWEVNIETDLKKEDEKV
jgi:hypothetical protein